VVEFRLRVIYGYNSLEKQESVVSIAEQLTEDMKASMRAGDTEKTRTLRLLKSSMKNEEIKAGHVLNDDEALKLLQREAKQRKDSITAYESAGRNELAATENSELTIIQGYLPQALSEDELKQIVDEVVNEMGATDSKQMGVVIGGVMKRVGSQADGGTVSKLVRERLSA
jgi:uncharacterized protein YqeY